MKPAKFDYVRPRGLDEALAALAQGGDEARPIAGGQSLGPMLNLRLATPSLLVDLSAIAGFVGVTEDDDELVIGAGTTHAMIEDGAGGAATNGFLTRVAAGIAYRPVRNRGTVAGSLAHADPGGDWAPVMMALGAVLDVRGPGGGRKLAVSDLIDAPLATVLEPGEIIVAIRIPRLGPDARWGHRKFARKPGDFADAIAAAVIDRARGMARLVLSTRTGVPGHLAAAEQCLRRQMTGSAWDWPAIETAIDDDLERRGLIEQWPAWGRSLPFAVTTRALKEALS